MKRLAIALVIALSSFTAYGQLSEDGHRFWLGDSGYSFYRYPDSSSTGNCYKLDISYIDRTNNKQILIGDNEADYVMSFVKLYKDELEDKYGVVIKYLYRNYLEIYPIIDYEELLDKKEAAIYDRVARENKLNDILK